MYDEPNQTLQPTGHANNGSARYGALARVSRLLSWGRSAENQDQVVTQG
jgi:hypothetical protein